MRIAIDWKQRGRELVLLSAIAAFLTLTDMYGVRGALGLPLAGIYWLGLLIVGALTGEVSVALYYRGDASKPAWLMFVIVSLATTLAVFMVSLGLDAALGRSPPVSALPAYFAAIWMIAAAVTAISYMSSRAFGIGGPQFATAPAAGAEPTQRLDPVKTFLERLPLKFRSAELWAISSEDHYLRVHTNLGTELILMRLADAVRELNGADGLQVHRSWWAARVGIKESQQDNGRVTLVLHSGVEVPVSRTFVSAVRDAKLV